MALIAVFIVALLVIAGFTAGVLADRRDPEAKVRHKK